MSILKTEKGEAYLPNHYKICITYELNPGQSIEAGFYLSFKNGKWQYIFAPDYTSHFKSPEIGVSGY